MFSRIERRYLKSIEKYSNGWYRSSDPVFKQFIITQGLASSISVINQAIVNRNNFIQKGDKYKVIQEELRLLRSDSINFKKRSKTLKKQLRQNLRVLKLAGKEYELSLEALENSKEFKDYKKSFENNKNKLSAKLPKTKLTNCPFTFTLDILDNKKSDKDKFNAAADLLNATRSGNALGLFYWNCLFSKTNSKEIDSLAKLAALLGKENIIPENAMFEKIAKRTWWQRLWAFPGQLFLSRTTKRIYDLLEKIPKQNSPELTTGKSLRKNPNPDSTAQIINGVPVYIMNEILDVEEETSENKALSSVKKDNFIFIESNNVGQVTVVTDSQTQASNSYNDVKAIKRPSPEPNYIEVQALQEEMVTYLPYEEMPKESLTVVKNKVDDHQSITGKPRPFPRLSSKDKETMLGTSYNSFFNPNSTRTPSEPYSPEVLPKTDFSDKPNSLLLKDIANTSQGNSMI